MINIPSTKFCSLHRILARPAVLGGASALLINACIFAPASSASNLTFDVTARIASTSADGKSTGPSQTWNARASVSGKKVRLDSGTGKARSVLLFTPPYVYRLLLAPKAGIRWQLDTKNGANFRAFDPQQLLSSPSQIRSMLLAQGAKRIGSSVLGGTSVDIYEVRKPGERISYAKAWVGRTNALPYRLEAKGQGVNVMASWKNYARPAKLAPSLFQPPAGFRIRTVTSAPPLSGM